MARKVLSEAATVKMVVNTAIGATPPTSGWLQWQPNPGGIVDWQRKNKTVERDPLSKFASMEKGDVVGFDAEPKLTHDLNFETLYMAAGSIFRCAPVNPGGTDQVDYRPTVVVDGGGGADSFTVATNGAVPEGRLIKTSGFAIAQNNGLFVVAASSDSDSINVATGTLAAEASAPANARLLVVGVRAGSGDIQLNASGHLISSTLDLTTLDLSIGSTIIIGGEAVGTRFASLHASKPMVAIIASTPTANLIELEQRNFAIGADNGSGKTIDLYFGPFFRNYSIDDANYLEPILHGELEDIKAATGNTVSAFTYAEDLALNTFEIDAPLQDKMVATYNFIGTDIPNPVLTASRLTGPSSAYAPLLAALFDTAADQEYVGLYDSSGTQLGEVNSWKLTIDNGVSARKIQGQIEAVDHNYGKFTLMVTQEIYFSDYDQTIAVNDNRDLVWKMMAGNHQGGFAIHAPLVAARDGGKQYAANEPIMMNLGIPGFRDPDTNIVGAMTLFGYVPNGGDNG